MVEHAGTYGASHIGLVPEQDPKSFLLSGEPWKAILFLLLSFGIGFALSGALSMLLAFSLLMSLFVVGIPLLALTAVAWTYMARLERVRIALLTGVEIPNPYRHLPSDGLWPKVRVFATDPAVWKDLIYLLFLFPVGVIQLIIVFFAVATPLSMLGAPLGVVMGDSVTIHNVEIQSIGMAIVTAVIGFGLLPVSAYVVTICARSHGLFAKRLLGSRDRSRICTKSVDSNAG
jgi:hypothetical protein